MAQARGGLGLALRARGGLPFARDDLERDVELRLLVAGEPDRAGAAAAERLEGPVAAEHELGEGEGLGGLGHTLAEIGDRAGQSCLHACPGALGRSKVAPLEHVRRRQRARVLRRAAQAPAARTGARRPRSSGRAARAGRGRRPARTASSASPVSSRSAIAIVFGFVFWIGSCSGQSKQDYTSYIDAMQPLAQDSASVGEEFATALGTPGLTHGRASSRISPTGRSRSRRLRRGAAAPAARPAPERARRRRSRRSSCATTGLVGLASTLTLAQQKRERRSVAAGRARERRAAPQRERHRLGAALQAARDADSSRPQNVTGVIVPASQLVTNPDIVSAPSLATVYQRLGTPSTGGHGVTARIHGSDLLVHERRRERRLDSRCRRRRRPPSRSARASSSTSCSRTPATTRR